MVLDFCYLDLLGRLCSYLLTTFFPTGILITCLALGIPGSLKYLFGVSGQLDCYLLSILHILNSACLWLLDHRSFLFFESCVLLDPCFSMLNDPLPSRYHLPASLTCLIFLHPFLQSTTIVHSPRIDIFRA